MVPNINTEPLEPPVPVVSNENEAEFDLQPYDLDEANIQTRLESYISSNLGMLALSALVI